ncbi:MAG TPA: hypothetical protein VNN17_05575 [Terriglobia bacterium]|nr:hypothetical protein [Terriglobia bacterium]
MAAFRNALLCGLLFAGMVLAVQAGILLAQLSEATARMEQEAGLLVIDLRRQNAALLDTQGQARALLAQGQATLRQAEASLQAASVEIARARADLNANSETLLGIAHYQLGMANRSLAMTGWSLSAGVASAADSINQVTGQAAQIESQVSEALSLSLDCDHNADCFHNRWVGAARGIEQASLSLAAMAGAWGEAAPRQAAATTGLLEKGEATAGHAEEITADLAKKPPLWLKVVKYAKWLWPFRW